MQLIDREAYQQKLLEIMYSSVLDNMIDSSIYKDDDSAKNAIRYGICLASLFTCDCTILHAKLKEETVGEWQTDKVAFMKTCSECGESVDFSHAYNYCPNCGVKMRIKDAEQKEM